MGNPKRNTKLTGNPWYKQYQAFIEGIVDLFYPYLEAAVHDLKSGKVVMIYNNISQRKVGDSTPIHELKIDTEQFPDFFPSYYKENYDGRQLKCTSITIKDQDDVAVGLICFNFDTSVFLSFQSQLGNFLKVRGEYNNPIELFSNDSQAKMRILIQEYLRDQGLSMDHMSKLEKRELVQYLYSKGVFNFKNAPSFLAKTLSVSRASIYNYLEKT